MKKNHFLLISCELKNSDSNTRANINVEPRRDVTCGYFIFILALCLLLLHPIFIFMMNYT